MAVIFGVFAFVAFASASTADVLQPASDVVYDENLIVNGTGIFDSVRIGKQDVGGVTFFNGTIVNETTDENDDGNPVTFGDDVRIDGMLWRGEEAGPGDNMPVKFQDDVWVQGVLTGGGSVVVDDDLEVNQSGTFVGKLTVNSNIEVDGNIEQNEDSYGAVKAAVRGAKDSDTCINSFSSQGTTITCDRASAGEYIVDFGFDVSDRFWQVTPLYESGPGLPQHRVKQGDTNSKIEVHLYNNNTGNYTDYEYMVTIY